jgi:hypothetical protein
MDMEREPIENLDDTEQFVEEDFPTGDTPTYDVAPEGSHDAVETGIFNNPGEGSTGNTILDQGIGGTAGVTPSIDTSIGLEEGEGYTEPEDAPDEDERQH